MLDYNICSDITELQKKYFPKMIDLNESNDVTKKEFREFGGCYYLKKTQSKFLIIIEG